MLQAQIGAVIRQLREQIGWSQEQLARKLDTTKQSISLIEQGASRTPIDKLETIIESLGGRITVDVRAASDTRAPVWCAPELRALLDDAARLSVPDIDTLVKLAKLLPDIEDEGKHLAVRAMEREAGRGRR